MSGNTSRRLRLFIEPVDVWQFRDGKPFNAGSDHHAGCLFPPAPSVIHGALRAAHASLNGFSMDDYIAGRAKELEAMIGRPGDAATPFRVEGPHIARRVGANTERYFPRPDDAHGVKGGLRASHPSPTLPVRTNIPSEISLLSPVDVSPIADGIDMPNADLRWVREDALRRYLHESEPAKRHIALEALEPEDAFIVRETRVGISLVDDERRAEDGALYEADFVRLNPDVGLEVRAQGLEGWPASGLIKFGGDNRLARFYASYEDFTPAAMPALPRRFRLYFATPAFFHGGWKPDSWSTFFVGPEPRLIGAGLRRYESRGGFDLFAYASKLANPHKPGRRYVPAGSIYYFESENNQTRLKSENVTELGWEAGYGQVIVGRWD